ncbi:MAG: M20 family metallopeptidase [Eubacteriales bacterium]|nr:M20 family metallopeptidase [Eubacteriales bacterium]
MKKYIDLQEYYDELLMIRRWLHRHPELSMEERHTSEYIACYLEKCGLTVQRTGDVGVIATLFSDRGQVSDMADEKCRTIAIRAEIDALPIQEATGLIFSSENPGVMHACGHDCITAVALCLAKILSTQRKSLKHNVRFIFEPAEETGQGAKYMMEHGALENPQVDEILIFHFANQEPRGMEIQKSITTAGVCGITFRIKGKSTHWFEPENGRDAMYGAAKLIEEIHDINAGFPAEYPFVLGFGLMKAGAAGNIMAEEAMINGSLRTFTKKDADAVLEELKKRMKRIEQETDLRITMDMGRSIPAFHNHAQLVKRGAEVGRDLMGERFMLGEKPFLVGDNAAFYAEKIPGMRTVFLAGKPGEKCCPVHNPGFDIDETVMMDALRFFYRMVI